MRKSRNLGVVGPRAAARILAGVLALSLMQPSEAAAQSECGEYISGGPDHPVTGQLMGSQKFSLDFGFGFRLTFSIGTYRMHDASHLYFWCGFE